MGSTNSIHNESVKFNVGSVMQNLFGRDHTVVYSVMYEVTVPVPRAHFGSAQAIRWLFNERLDYIMDRYENNFAAYAQRMFQWRNLNGNLQQK